MRSGSTRPNTRFLVEPELTNDPVNFGRNKLAHKAQIRIIDGVWYLKDPGTDNSAAGDGDDGPWPGIPIWSDHPGEFTTTLREGVEGGVPLQVGQSDIRAALDAGTDPRLAKAKWSARRRIGASPTPRRFSYYAFVDHVQAAAAEAGPQQGQLSPAGQGLQFGRVHATSSSVLDVDPPAVISYGGLAPVQLSGTFDASAGPPTEGDNTYWLPGVRFADKRFNAAAHVSYAPRGRSDAGYCGFDPALLSDDVRSSVLVPAVPQPLDPLGDGMVGAISYPSARQPLPGDGTAVPLAPGSDGWSIGRLCAGDNEAEFRRRMRLALLDATRTGFVDTNNHRDTRLNAAARENVLPINFNLHAFQEALADKTPGELGSYFCDDGCLWPRFNGTVFISDNWRGSMVGTSVFPDGIAAPPPNPVVIDQGVDSGERQPHIPVERRSTTGPLPFPLCSAPSDEPAVAHAQVVGRRFVEADEIDVHTGSAAAPTFTMPYNDGDRGFGNTMLRTMALPPTASPREASTTPSYPDPAASVPGSFRIPECARYSLSGGVWSSVVPAAVRVINGRTINYNRSSCGDSGNARCLPELSSLSVSHARSATRQLDDGLNVVTNMPMYIMGDINQTSEVNDVATGRRATDWIPVMFAADSVTTMSNAWDDEHSRWGVSTNDSDLNVTSFTERAASTTRYTMLLLTGLVGAGSYAGGGRAINAFGTSGGGLHNVMRLMEDWRGEQHIFRGAMVLGWMPVYTQWRVGRPGDRSYEPPALRNWQFDRHLNATVNQPPDSPVFDVTALRNWRRE
jgi:hypothetical protein